MTVSFISLQSHPRQARFIALIALLIAAHAIGCDKQRQPKTNLTQDNAAGHLSSDSPASEDVFHQAVAAFERKDTQVAQQLLRKLLIAEPENDHANLLAARIAEEEGNPARALEFAAMVSDNESIVYVTALEIVERQATITNDARSRERALRELIQLVPTKGRHGLSYWKLLHRQGRTYDAALIADRLCQLGIANIDVMKSLAFREASFPKELPPDESPQQHFDEGLGRARWYLTQGQLTESISELENVSTTNSLSLPALALYGRLLALTQKPEAMRPWLEQCQRRPGITRLTDYWSAIAITLVGEREFSAAVEPLIQVLQRNPVSPVTYQRLGQVMDAIDQPDIARMCRERGVQIRETQNLLDQSNLNTERAIVASIMARKLLAMARPLEALQWSELALPESETQHRRVIMSQRNKLIQTADLVEMKQEHSLVGLKVDLNELNDSISCFKNCLPIASLSTSQTSTSQTLRSNNQKPGPANSSPPIVLTNVASEMNLEAQWFHASENMPNEIALFESIGGGVGVIDYDQDGNPDLYVAQGAREAPSADLSLHNQMFRNLGNVFKESSHSTETADHLYTQGVAVGDINQDGWPDLWIGNIGPNRILFNQGDGTFTDRSMLIDESSPAISTSMSIADIDSDHLPDLFAVNYIDQTEAFIPVQYDEEQHEIAVGPLSHPAEADKWHRNLGNGQFTSTIVNRKSVPPSTGLGIIVGDFDGKSGNEIFIGNDARRNHLLRVRDNTFTNMADALGVASGFHGAATACMGIAHGDFNQDGKIDFHVTNFHGEYDNLFIQNDQELFRDLAPRHGLADISQNYLGFGTKADDLDHDGDLDLLVACGHISDRRHQDVPFQMPTQLLENHENRFAPHQHAPLSKYWTGRHLGRAVASLDFNSDGRTDFAITHLDSPLALLDNQTQSRGHSVQLELVGVQCERDAIGASLRIATNQRTLYRWVTAGDGYLCSDQAIVQVPLRPNEAIEQIEIQWPNDTAQTLDQINSGKRYLIVQGHKHPYARFSINHH